MKAKLGLTLGSAIALLCGSMQIAHAHAGFKEPLVEGVKSWNGVTIGHGCADNAGGEGSAAQKDVIAFSAIFPDANNFGNVVFRGSKGTVKGTAPAETDPEGTVYNGQEAVISDLSNDIEGATAADATTPKTYPLALTVLTRGNIFDKAIPVVDGKNVVRGWQSWNVNGQNLLESRLKTDGTSITTTGVAPFAIGAIKFKPESCAKTLKIRVPVADWCMAGAKNASNSARVDVWIGSKTTKFNDDHVMPNANSNPIYWTTLTLNRDLVKNPLPGTKGFDPASIGSSSKTAVGDTSTGIIDRTQEGWKTGAADASGNAVTSTKISCADATAYDTVYVEPVGTDIDNFLPISSAKYPLGADGRVFWPNN